MEAERDAGASAARASRAQRLIAEHLRPKWALPIRSAITSAYGLRRDGFHNGVDFSATTGTPIHSAGDGYVVHPSDGTNGYGTVLTVAHPDGSVTWYAHLSVSYVHPGQHVQAGDIIGLSGATGHVTGPHLHFEVRFNNHTVDPARWLHQHNIAV